MKKTWCLVLIALLGIVASSTAADTLFVNPIAEPGGDGQSWNTAHRYLENAITAWQSGDEIWVSKGTIETQSTGIALNSTHSGIRIYGGFSGGETTREARDWYRNATILRAGGTRFGVMTLVNCDSLTRIDGLIFENANNIAVSVTMGAPHFRNCVFRNNTSAGSGSAMTIVNVERMRIEYCVFENNSSAFDAGAVYVLMQEDTSGYGFGMLFGQCVFKNNTSVGGMGGAVYCDDLKPIPQFSSCVFYGNKAAMGGALATTKTYAYLTNCTFAKNNGTTMGALGYSAALNGGHIQNCVFWNGDLADTAKHILDVDLAGGDTNTLTTTANLVEKDFVLGFYQSDPQFENLDNPEGPDGYFGTDDDGLRLSSFSSVREAGVIDRFVNHRQTDATGNPRLVARKNDLGAYESQRAGRPSNPELLAELKTGLLTLFFRHAKTDWDQNDPGPSPECFPGRNLIFEGREQSVTIGNAQRFLGVPIGDVESSPVCRCWETAELMTGRYEKVSYWGSGGAASLQRVRDSVLSTAPVGGIRVITSHDAIANATFNPDGDGRDLTSAELMEGDCMFIRPMTDTFAVVGQWCSDTWERYHVRYDVPTSVNEGPCYGQKVTGVVAFPNPTSDLLYISSESEGSIHIVDVTGRVIETLPNGMNYSVDVSRWNSGMYRVVNTTTGQGASVIVAP